MAEHQAGSLDPAAAHDLRPVARPGAAELICLLAAGAELAPAALGTLAAVLDARPDVAAVAPAVVDEAGAVLEAGGVIGGDGWCRPHRPDPDALFPREVDHPGGTCLVVRRAALEQAGGLSTAYATAEFRAADLALALRERGWRTWLEPAARIVRSRPANGASGEARRRDHATFLRRWGAALAGRPPVAGLDEHPYRLWWLRDRLAPFRVLLIDDRVPQADRGRGDPRTRAVLDAWRDSDPGARVTFFAASDDGAEQRAPALRAEGVEVVWGVGDAVRWARDRAGLYDAVVVFRPHNFAHLGEPIARAQPQAVRVYDSEALFHRRAAQYRDPAADRLREVERRAFRWADVAVCVSEEEAGWAREVAPDTAVHVVCYPAAVPAAVPGRAHRAGLVFFGAFDSTPGTPNEDTALVAAGRLLPALRRNHPGLTLRIVGADPSPAVLDLDGGPVTVLGKVADPLVELGSALLHVAPMRYGAGVKLKFIDSMAAGLPFVTTPVGAEGLHLGATARHLVGESPAELVALCDALLSDSALWTETQRSLVDICREHFSARRFEAAMRGVLADCALGVRSPLRGSQPAAQ